MSPGRILLLASGLLAAAIRPAAAGAWTLPEGHTQIIAGVFYSRAGTAYGPDSRATLPVQYSKTLAQIHAEYGWNDWLTLIAAPSFAHARLADMRAGIQQADDFGFEGGARLRLSKAWGVVSLEATARTSGAFNATVSVDGASAQQLELRLLYGANFSLWGKAGFLDAEIGQRWIAGHRPDETPIDLTIGITVTGHTQLLMQSFNILAQGNARAPYSYYRTHKLSASVVTEIRPGWRLESGGYVVAAGQNALLEQGFVARLWVDL